MAYKLDFKAPYLNVINNELTSTAQRRHGVDPSTEEALPEVPVSGKAELDRAVAAAKTAYPAWRSLSWDERGSYLLKLADAIEANHDDFRDLDIAETGKPFQHANFEMVLVLAHLRGTESLRIPDDVVEDTPEKTMLVRYRPLGVGAAIVPWNWPLLLGLGKIGPAVLAGNTIIVKPSPYAPYSLLRIGELAAKIFPPGIIQVLSGDESLGPLFTEHPGIAKVSFTGSIATGRKVAEACGRTLKRVTLELGGNDAAVICEDADLARTVPGVSFLAFLCAGQICMNIKRVYVHDKIYDAFLAAMVTFIRDNMPYGPAADPKTIIGPLQNSVQYEKVKKFFAEAETQKWTIALGGLEEEAKIKSKGLLLPPTLIDNPSDDSRIVVEEPFGPILPVMRWTDEKEVISRVNAVEAGLGASVWSSNIEKATEIADALEAGSVWINNHFQVSPNMPFGGHKASGIGMDWGVVGLKGWCNPQGFWTFKK
ncbi:aldehyde dehydrogenase [Cryphonectria parasitica EP155]|uniref:aldehyde dehydrogenase (NAD(+)) n=1 Tax=Cryphonectria parasitica (strain ATCC 38755 / EP155) TaxID=660469 RepID=A0A9P4XZ55_CRYP1|nr:aldehyde dehydrogenase [Cryphonectria parasitica EP155]KAF3764032.1 aldehyde dehydrogenase [Cryphonectria parasitica EP155]